MKSVKNILMGGAALLIMLSLLFSAAAADTQPPSPPIGLTVTEITHTSVSLVWKAAHDNISVKGYQIYRDGKKIASVTKTAYTDNNLIPGTKYAYEIKAYDAAGNLSLSSSSLSTETKRDLQEPSTPEALTVSSVSFTSAVLSWKPSTDNIGIKGYEIFCNGKKAALTTSTFYEYKKLAPGAAYTFSVRACDKSGNYSSQSNTVSLTALPDNSPPAAPDKLNTASVTVTEVNLFWQPSTDNVEVKGYDIIRDGIKIGTTNKTSYCSKGLLPGKSYTYTVRAFDISGNLSDSSSPITVTTPKDTQKPTPPSELKITGTNGSSVSLTWKAAADNSKVAGYQIYCNGIVIATATGTSRTVKSPFGLDSDIFWIKAYDLGGNLSENSNTVIVSTASEN